MMTQRHRLILICVFALLISVVIHRLQGLKKNDRVQFTELLPLQQRALVSGDPADYARLFALCDEFDSQQTAPLGDSRRVIASVCLNNMASSNAVIRPDLVKLMLTNGSSATSWGGSGDSVLCCYITSGVKVDSIQVLLDAGAKTDRIDRSQSNALLVAVQAKRVDVVSVLLKRGVRGVRQFNRRGETALGLAKKRGDESLIALLSRASIRENTLK